MNICSGSGSDRHDEVVFEGNDCPVCVLMAEVIELNNEIGGLNAELDELRKDD